MNQDGLKIEGEIWKDIPITNGSYQISNLGRVKSLPKWYEGGACKYWTKERILKPMINKQTGYPRVFLRVGGKAIVGIIHRLVAKAFIPNPDNKPEVNHIDCDRENYQIENLEWVTRRENAQHSARLGRFPYNGHLNGELNHNAKLTGKDVLEIRRLKEKGWIEKDLAKKFDISRSNVYAICKRKVWKHL